MFGLVKETVVNDLSNNSFVARRPVHIVNIDDVNGWDLVGKELRHMFTKLKD